ncbi:MAG: hypothetical protein OEU25_09675 [Rhodospirillales bacterium]|nr:hypothetical protein [Rhodospirillales bacterium]
MYYDLDILEELSKELGFPSSRSAPDALEVAILEGVSLEFHNLRDAEDTLAGFSGTQWHFHGKIMLMTGDATYVELDELEILQGIKSGAVLVAEQYLNGTLNDRWLAHKDEKVDVQYIAPGEEIRFRRLA